MAGAGYKLFNTGDVLTAAQVNTYLQEQTVMVFASSTARTTALSGVLAEGMMSYLQDTNAVEVYNGSSWVNVGNAGDLTEIVAGTGITVTSGTGPIPTVALTTPVAATNGGTAQSTYTTGDLLYASATNTLAKRAIGSTDQVLKVSGGIPTWAVDPTTDVVTTAGDLIYGTGADAVTRLGIGTAGQVLKVNSGATAPEWGAAGGGGANWTLSNTGGTTLSGSATVTVNITAADKIMVIVSGASSASAASRFDIRFNSDTANNYYQYGGSYQYNSTYSAGIGGSVGTDYSEIRAVTMSSNAASLGRIFLRLDGGNASGLKSFISFGTATTSGGDSQVHNYLGGYYNSTSTITSVSVISGTGNFDAGTIFIYTSS